MYVTRTLSRYRRNPVEVPVAAAAPQSGLMVLRGREAAEKVEVRGFINKGLFKELPLPSNAVFFTSTLMQLACQCATEDDESFCCSGRFIPDMKPKPFDHRDESLQFEICSATRDCFIAKPVVPHGLTPRFLRFRFRVFVRNERVYDLRDDAKGLNISILSHVPELGSGENLIVGKWYTPFVFVKDCSLRVQMETSLFYNVTLERLWEKIYSWENDDGRGRKGDVVALSVEIEREVDFLFGVQVVRGGGCDDEGFVWFGSGGVGLSSAVFEGMRWIEELVGWVDGVERVDKVVEIGGDGGGWRRFECYVLVERFALRRMDGTLVLNCDFRHTHEIRIKWG
ncbi:hypothetical protein F3Y22_tig00112856pilonHSYRG00122 [Hibiscus syriacus]|uniref:Uncharacterized protein n=1 Tax=Hibiscus syriacus TaxID=106335 RepID=A0A6A2WSJ3_HIBSY|nr:hypothetical protein F3Y22_tig00112856pilonHSYRG00122 [Hibiscus syriacus]